MKRNCARANRWRLQHWLTHDIVNISQTYMLHNSDIVPTMFVFIKVLYIIGILIYCCPWSVTLRPWTLSVPLNISHKYAKTTGYSCIRYILWVTWRRFFTWVKKYIFIIHQRDKPKSSRTSNTLWRFVGGVYIIFRDCANNSPLGKQRRKPIRSFSWTLSVKSN